MLVHLLRLVRLETRSNNYIFGYISYTYRGIVYVCVLEIKNENKTSFVNACLIKPHTTNELIFIPLHSYKLNGS